MPKLRLNQVLSEKAIKVDEIPDPKVQQAIASLRGDQKTGEIIIKLDKNISEDIRLVSEALNISIFDLFIPAEKFYRLRILENLKEPEYSGNEKEKLTKLLGKLPLSSKISFNLLAIYSTQVLPESLLEGSDLEQFCKVLGVSVEDLKEISSEPNQTISVESILISLGINLDELSILLEVPKKFIPWINTSKPRVASKKLLSSSRSPLSLSTSMKDRGSISASSSQNQNIFCEIFDQVEWVYKLIRC